jgi:electron transfer flavoprotein alpha subunit
MEVGARLAYRLDGGLAQNVMSVELADGALVATRPVFGGAAVATIRLGRPPWVVVPRPGSFAAAQPAAQPGGELTVVRPTLATADFQTSCGARTREQSTAQQLERARAIIAGGRGLGGAEPFQLLGEIAELLGAAVGASRPPCDAGWAPSGLQVGLTGKTVAPDLYIAVGISGAIQHLSGCSSSRVIVAVNSDPEAPIFRAATYGAVGKWQEILPAFRDALARA